MSSAPEPSHRFSDLAGGAQFAPVYAALARIVPPSETRWLPSIAVAVQELVDSCPWLGRELRFYFPPLQHLPELVSHLQSSPPGELPKEYVDEYPAQAALAFAPTKDSWIRPPKALMLAVALRAIFPSRGEESAPDDRAERGVAELSRFARGLKMINVRQSREAFLQAAEGHSSPLAYATALREYMDHPDRLPATSAARMAKPDKELLRALKKDIVPLLQDLPPPQGRNERRRKTEGWERDDDDEPDARIRLRLRPSPDSIDTDFEEDSVDLSFSQIEDLGRLPAKDLALLEDPFPPRIATTQAIHSGNSLLSKFHADALTKGEIARLLPALDESLNDAMSAKDASKVSLLLTLMLMFATGLTKERAVAILANEAYVAGEIPVLSDTCEELIAPALNPHSQAERSNHTPALVLDQDSHIRIPLPPKLASRLRTFRHWFPPGFASAQLLDEIYPLLRSIADSVGLTAATLGRLRRTAAPLLFGECNDLVAVMHLSRDTFGRSVAPLHYVSFDEQVLRGIYRRAMWSHFGDDPKQGNELDDAGRRRIGSEFCPSRASAERACATIGSSLHAGKPAPANATPSEAADVHNTMAVHLAALLVSAVGHRPHSALFRLTIHDFDTDRQLALFSDKDIDPAHLTRLVALGTEVSNQIERYIRHLYGLIDCKHLPTDSIARIRRTLKGVGPLIFRMDECGGIRNWSVALWQEMLPRQWHILQPNFGRHYLASSGRELHYSPEWIHIQLGHQDVAGYPFSPDSPLFPIDLAKQIGPLIDQIFNDQGWKRRNGFEPASSLPDPWAQTGPLRVTYSYSVRFRRKLNDARKRFKSELRAQLRPIKDAAEKILVEKALTVAPPLSEALCFRYNMLRQERGEVLLEWPVPDRKKPQNLMNLMPIEFDQSRMESLLSLLEEEAGSDGALQIALTNQLAYALEWLRKRRKYAGPYCGAYRMRPLPDESPFYEGIFRATKQICALRELFAGFRTGPSEEGSPEEVDWEIGKVALAICIFGQVDDLSTLWGLLSASAKVERIPASPESLLVHLPGSGATAALHGPAALAFSRWRRTTGGLSDSIENAEPVLDRAIQLLLPRQCLRKGQGIHALLRTVRAANRFELPGLFRIILDSEEGAVSLQPDRLRSLLDPAHRASGTAGPAPDIENWTLERNQRINDIDAQVRILQSLIPDDDKDVSLPITGETIRLSSRQYEPAREKLLNELSCWENHEGHDAIVRYLAGWLGHLAQRPKLRGSGNLSWGSVQKYFGAVALPLVGLVGRGGLKELSVEDLEDLYLSLLAELPEKKQAAACTQLLSFHDYLVSEHGFESIDTSNFRDFATRESISRNVSNQIVLPAEQDLVVAHLQWLSDPDSHPAGYRAEFRLHTQAFLCFALAAATGARINEIGGLKHKDVIRIGAEIALILRPNGYRRLKTPSARRLVDAGKCLAPNVLQRLNRWLSAERDRIGPDHFHNHYVFCDLRNELVGTAHLRSMYTPTLKAINSHISSHHLRHTRVNHVLVELLLGSHLDELHLSGVTGKSVDQAPILPRQLVLETAQIGHRRPRTSATCYFHMPFVASIAAQQRLHGYGDKKRDASAMGISTSGLDNLSQRWKGEHFTRFLDRCVPRKKASGSLPEPDKRFLPRPINSTLPLLSRAVDLMAQGVPVSVAQESLGLAKSAVELLLEGDRQQAINTGIALVSGNPNGNVRNSTYPRWRAGSSFLQSMWSKVELEQDLPLQKLLHGWRLSANRSDRSRFRWDTELVEIAKACLDEYSSVEVNVKREGRLYDVSILIGECEINHELAFTLAVADVVASAMNPLDLLPRRSH